MNDEIDALDDVPAPPEPDLSPAALALWVDFHESLAERDLEPTPMETRLISDAVRTANLADTLAATLAEGGTYTVPGARGTARPHPLLAEIDRARRTTAAIIKQLQIQDRATAGANNVAKRWRRG